MGLNHSKYKAYHKQKRTREKVKEPKNIDSYNVIEEVVQPWKEFCISDKVIATCSVSSNLEAFNNRDDGHEQWEEF